MRDATQKTMMIPLETASAPIGKWPICSEEGCTQHATWWLGHYATDATQGEHSITHGWFFCQPHAITFRNRVILEDPANRIIPPNE